MSNTREHFESISIEIGVQFTTANLSGACIKATRRPSDYYMSPDSVSIKGTETECQRLLIAHWMISHTDFAMCVFGFFRMFRVQKPNVRRVSSFHCELYAVILDSFLPFRWLKKTVFSWLLFEQNHSVVYSVVQHKCQMVYELVNLGYTTQLTIRRRVETERTF